MNVSVTQMSRPRRAITIVAGLSLLLSSLMVGVAPDAEAATSITIENPGFETDVLGETGFFEGDITGAWTNSGRSGPFNPSAAELTAEAPEGQNVAFSNNQPISQVLAHTLTAGNTYSLSVQVGSRASQPNTAYSVELLAGGVVIASAGSPTPPINGYVTAIVEYDALDGDPQLGTAVEIRLLGISGQGLFDDVRLMVSDAPGATGSAIASSFPGTPVCIESPLVQTDVAAATLAVGDSFYGTDNGVFYQITIGEPGCSFNCLDGLDANCDGEIGDYCPTELNVNRVVDAVTCLELLSASSIPAALPISAAAVPAAAIPVPAAQPDPAAGSTLALTGSTTDLLVPTGFGLIAAGACAAAFARRRRR